MMKFKCLLVDDEPLAREVITDYIADCPELELCGQFANAFQAREFLAENKVDLIFLDISMPRMSGVSFAKSLNDAPAIIFITAHPEYAVDGFELEAIDYLLKPVAQDRFLKAINRFLDKSKQATPMDDSIMVKADKKLFRLMLSDILYVEAMGDYIRIHTGEQSLTVYERFSVFVDKLPVVQFCRIHKSYLVSLTKIEYMEANQVKIGELMFPVSATYKEQFLRVFKP